MGWATGEPCVLFPRPVTCPHYSFFFSRDRIGGHHRKGDWNHLKRLSVNEDMQVCDLADQVVFY